MREKPEIAYPDWKAKKCTPMIKNTGAPGASPRHF
jgi:hypothetical protein